MVRANSAASLAAEKQKAREGYREQLVYAAKKHELSPQDKNAALALLNLMPQNAKQQLILTTLSTSMCDSETVRDMVTLARLEDRLPHDFTSAVLLVPGKIQAYVSYGSVAIGDPHSDFALQMKRVCRVNHSAFISAADSLDKVNWGEENFAYPSSERFRTKIFDPVGCRPLEFPEAD